MSPTEERERELSVRIAALEVLLRRLISDGERASPGHIDRLAGHYDLAARPTVELDAFVAAVDDQVSTFLALARAEARRPRH